MENPKVVIFRLGNQSYAINIGVVEVIEKSHKLTKVPNSPSYIKGLMDVRGKIIPIYSLCDKLGILDTQTDHHVIIVTYEERMIGLEVDFVQGIIEANQSNQSEFPDIICEEGDTFISSIIRFDKELISIIDVDSLCSLF